MSQRLRIASRESPLAMWQAEHIKAALQARHQGLQIDILGMTTRGDKILDTPLAKIGGKGLFVKELELALLDGRADIAVHSMKDVPMAFPQGLELGVICLREDPRDALVSNHFGCVDDLPQGARLGTSSLRRQCQLRATRPDLQIVDLRGNVNTRLRKLDEGHFDAIILAAAGLLRLGLGHRIASSLAVEECLPAGGQGALGIELRVDDLATRALLEPLGDESSACCVRAERALNATLNGGCQVPIACYAVERDGSLWLRGLVGDSDSGRLLRAEASAPLAQCEVLGRTVAERLIEQGALDILKAVMAGQVGAPQQDEP